MNLRARAHSGAVPQRRASAHKNRPALAEEALPQDRVRSPREKVLPPDL